MLRNPSVLQDFLNAALPGMKTDLGDLAATNNELFSIYKSGKKINLDLNLKTASGELVNVEMQLAKEPGCTNRMQMYLSRLHASQLEAGDEYLEAHRAISIWICGFVFLPGPAYYRSYTLFDKVNMDEIPRSMQLLILEATKYKNASGPMRHWLQFFAAKTEDELMSLAAQAPDMGYPCEFVRKMNMSKEERIIAEAREREWIDRAILRGAAFQDGKIEGKIEGKKDRSYEIAREMLNDGEPRAKILKYSRLTEAELDKLQ